MLGNGAASIYQGNQPPNDPTAISELVGWWDFTRTDTMFQNRDGTTAVTANNDQIHWIKNLAAGDGNGNKLGEFLRSGGTSSSYGATYKTGGLNSLGYAQFANDASDSTKGLRAGYFDVNSNLDGGVATNKFSDLVINLGNVTVFTVLDHDDATIETSSDNYFFLNGSKVGDTSVLTILYGFKNFVNPDQLKTFWAESGTWGGYSFSNSDAEWDDNPHLVMLNITDGTGNMKLFVDGTINSSPGKGDNDMNIDFSNTTGGMNTSPYVSIGCAVTTADGLTVVPWQGRIYEHLIYNKALTDIEIQNVYAYISSKYGLTIS